MDVLHPIVYWAQTGDRVSLKIDLKDAGTPEISLDPDTLNFKATGTGAAGVNEYQFELNFYGQMDPEGSSYRINDREIEFQLTKYGKGSFWPRLTQEGKRPSWLKIDFDRWKSETDTEEEEEVPGEENAFKKQCQELEKELRNKEQKARQDIKKGYLVVYNVLQCVGFSCIFLTLVFYYLYIGQEFVTSGDMFKAAVVTLVMCQMAMVLEVVHPLLGIVKTGVQAPLIQVVGRSFVLFMVIIPNTELYNSMATFCLFVVWSAIELVRYPYYMLSTLEMENDVVTWLRYHLWIPLYPAGILCESLVMWKSIALFEESGRWSTSLPNRYNFAFHFPWFLYCYFFMVVIGGTGNIMHMNKLRKKRYSRPSNQSAKKKQK